ncbi:MAG TPA: hypothetical protein VM510_16115 [Caulifigura sp.]|nr:hypothetical protein [Caulifigura sp.]
MQNTTPIMDRAEVERIAYQAIGQQFRLPSLFSMLLLVVGFVLGHYVAARHTGEIADRFEQRIAALTDKVAALESGTPVAARSTGDGLSRSPAAVHVSASEAETSPFDENNSTFRLAGMAQTFDSVSTDFTMISQSVLGETPSTSTASRDAIESLRQAAQEERDACLAELHPYVERRLSVPAATVVSVIEKIYADEDHRLADAMDDAAAKSNGINPRDTSVKIFPPMSEEGEVKEKAPEEGTPVTYRYFPKPAAPKSLFFAPTGNRVPPPATSAIDTDTIVR